MKALVADSAMIVGSRNFTGAGNTENDASIGALGAAMAAALKNHPRWVCSSRKKEHHWYQHQRPARQVWQQ